MIHIAIVDDDKKLAQSIFRWMKAKPEMIAEGAFSSVADLLSKKEELEMLDILLLDVELEETMSIPQVGTIKKNFPNAEIIILSSYGTEEYIFSALRAGVASYCLKGSGLDTLWNAILQTYNKGSYFDPVVARKVAHFFSAEPPQNADRLLTNREIEVVIGLVDGLSYKLIGNRLGISTNTVRHFVRLIYKKLSVNSKSEVIKMTYRGEIEGIKL